ncbi:GNAT family N-acetyltransferase [Acrodontium crateriforme]|uniref:GNAT family N-acetyltransferase n=1 Tax=Acrodontium crateriforme TaxID=150365 RepID=A0AAQ3MDX0_9PEZI|nr:GNAT family N-acetyltransferase [Acrodontium crateriforme]
MTSNYLSKSVADLLLKHRQKCADKVEEICAIYGSKVAYRKTLVVERIERSDDPRLTEFYQLYLSNFTLEHEQESLEGFAKVLDFNWDSKIQRDYGPFFEPIILLRDPANNELVGAADFALYAYPIQSSEYSGIDASCQLNFLVVRDTLRGVGIAFDLLNHVEMELLQFANQHTGQSPHKVFTTIEMNNPRRMTAEQLDEDATAALMDPNDRTIWWQKQGFYRLDLPYVQPALAPGGEACRYLDFFIRSKFSTEESPKEIPSFVIQEHVRRFFYVSVGKFETPMDDNVEWKEIVEFLGRHPSVKIIRT